MCCSQRIHFEGSCPCSYRIKYRIKRSFKNSSELFPDGWSISFRMWYNPRKAMYVLMFLYSKTIRWRASIFEINKTILHKWWWFQLELWNCFSSSKRIQRSRRRSSSSIKWKIQAGLLLSIMAMSLLYYEFQTSFSMGNIYKYGNI